jgi:NADH-quinone oxidoreductase subunit L
MQEDPGYPRYFAYLNLFVFFMLLLVLGRAIPLMFVGWEGVGLCSYLLIGFWFSEKANADAGKKAFIVNRIGDFGFLVAMFLMFANFGSLTLRRGRARPQVMAFGGALITAICLFLFLGARASRRRSRSSSGCRTPWRARRRSRRSSTRRRW